MDDSSTETDMFVAYGIAGVGRPVCKSTLGNNHNIQWKYAARKAPKHLQLAFPQLRCAFMFQAEDNSLAC